MLEIRYDKTLGYEYVLRNGKKVYYHRYAAEQIVGRVLKDTEVVHHIDRNRNNNNVDNLIVFRTDKDHAYHHTYEDIELIKHEDGTHSFPVELITKECNSCGCKFVSTNEMFCSRICANEYKKGNSIKKATYEQLKEDLKHLSYIAIGAKYGVSDNAIRKWCKSYSLPRTVAEKREFFGMN